MQERIITQKRLKEVLTYNPESGDFFWRESKGCAAAGKKIVSVDSSGYFKLKVDGNYYLLHRLAWLYTYGVYPLSCIDHINRNRRDNRISNLRLATNAENCRNAGMRSDNTSGVTGVGRIGSKWRVRIMVDGVTLYLGSYNDIELAELVAVEAKNKFHGSFSSAKNDWIDGKVTIKAGS